jgi:hypothetical protein
METSSFLIYAGNYTNPPSINNTALHFFPFAELPTFHSHVYPHYVIYNLGQKIQSIFGDDLEDADSGFQTFAAKLGSNILPLIIKQCHQVYKRWMRCQVPATFFQREGKEHDEQSQNPNNAPAEGNSDARMTRSKLGSRQGGNGATGSGAVPMERAYGGTGPQDDIHFEDFPDNVVYPEDSISCCLDGPLNGDDEERCAGDDGSSDILDDSDLWTQDISAWQRSVQYALSEEDVLEGGGSSSGSSSGCCSASSTMVDENSLCGKETVKVDVVARQISERFLGPYQDISWG